MFRRRNKQSFWQGARALLYPHKGWRRGWDYIRHRIKRLPDTPHKIAIGIACGVFVTFTPLFGLHFILAWLLALILRGNVLAAILATFVGNPFTFPFIAAISYRFGLFLLGMGKEETALAKIGDAFEGAFQTLWVNTKALFGYEKSTWEGFTEFLHDVFWPYLVGGILPGFISAVLFYIVSKQLITKYQNHRKLKLIAQLKGKELIKPE